jgi:hypothetical protein
MDFVPKPTNCFQGIEIPLLDIVPYSLAGNSAFPLGIGFNPTELTDTNISPLRVGNILQAWLYFGVLSSLLQTRIDPEDFAVQRKSDEILRQLTITPLRGLLATSSWASVEDAVELDRRRAILESAGLWLREIEDNHFRASQNELVMKITLSIRMLYYHLGPYSGMPCFEVGPHPLLSSRLLMNGWCPSQIREIEGLRNETVTYYLSHVQRPNPRNFSHNRCPRTNCAATSTTLSGNTYLTRHAHKDGTQCQPVLVDDTEVRRIIAGGGTPLISIHDRDGSVQLQVHRASARDQYVAISHVWADGLGNPKSNALPECQLRRLAKYLAELPNPSSRNADDGSRSLYSFGPLSVRIDIGKLKVVYRPSNPCMLFWMDTLCIPVARDENDTEVWELKRQAIDQMASIYSGASHVLVLDAALQESRIGVMTLCELLANVAFCNWMGRSWTLQEGAINPYVYFQFADGAFNVLDLLPRPDTYRNQWSFAIHPARFKRASLTDNLWSIHWTWKHGSPDWKDANSSFSPTYISEINIYAALYDYCTRSLHSSGNKVTPYSYANERAGMASEDAQWIQQLVSVWNALRTRTTTMEEDLPAIFANLLGLDTYKILALPSQKRLGAILRAGAHIPFSILYNHGPRLRTKETHHGRWIPTLIGRNIILTETPALSFDGMQKLVFETKRYLPGERPVMLFPQEPVALDNQVILAASDGTQWRISCNRDEDDQFDIERYNRPAFIISMPKPENVFPLDIPACCLRITGSTGSHHFEVIYDCPCIATWVPQNEQVLEDGVRTTDIREWSMTLQAGMEEQEVRRPYYQSPFPKWLNHLFYV